MEYEVKPYVVFVKLDDENRITSVNSSAFLLNQDGWTEIDRGYTQHHHHAQGNYFPEPIYTEGGAYRYKLVDGQPVECTAEEIAQQEEALKPVDEPTQGDRIEAQVMYTALMTDTLLDMEV